MTVLRSAAAVFARELRLAARHPAASAQPLVFYGLVAALFPLALDPQDAALLRVAPAIVWVGALLAALLGVERLFRNDLDDGTLELWLLSSAPLPLLVAAKLAAQWLIVALPLVLAAPLIGGLLGLPGTTVAVLTLGLALGTPGLIFSGGFAAALTVGAPRAGLLLPILTLPLMTPAVIFGAGAARAASDGLSFEAPLYALAALTVLGVTLLPFAAAGALRNAID